MQKPPPNEEAEDAWQAWTRERLRALDERKLLRSLRPVGATSSTVGEEVQADCICIVYLVCTLVCYRGRRCKLDPGA